MHASATRTATFLLFLASCGGAIEPVAPVESREVGVASPCGAIPLCGGDGRPEAGRGRTVYGVPSS
jgi:hypothetical protein